jgi:hypothetical protein
MSKSRFFAGVIVVLMFTFQAPAQTPDGPGVVVEPGAKILHRSPVFFPSGVTAIGSVVVQADVNAVGEVADAHIVSGPEELRRSVLLSVLDWRFPAGAGLRTVQNTIKFTAAPSAEPEPEIGCLEGVWAQDETSDWRWRFQAKPGELTISRTDGFVSGTFSRTGTVWTGQLHWGSGETYNNVVLAPAANCREVRTNQSWWFKR